jgi:hypothetical protein
MRKHPEFPGIYRQVLQKMGIFTKTCKPDGGGIRNDAGKPRYSLLPPDAMDEIVQVLTFGERKYGARNWERGMAWGRSLDAALRHVVAFMAGEEDDPESGIHHLAHAVADLMFVLAYRLRRIGTDDRGPKVQLPRRENRK